MSAAYVWERSTSLAFSLVSWPLFLKSNIVIAQTTMKTSTYTIFATIHGNNTRKRDAKNGTCKDIMHRFRLKKNLHIRNDTKYALHPIF